MSLTQTIERLRIAAYRFRDRHGDWRRIVCAVRGHEYPWMLVPACCLYFCDRCGKEICSRTLDQIDNLAPMTDDIREMLDQFEETA